MTTAKRNILNLTYIALGAVLIAAGAWITLPITAIPITMQTFAVFAVTLLLGGKRATASVVIYIALGLVGVPVFSSFRGGVGVLAGATGGYIVGFLTIPLIYWLFVSLFNEKYPIRALALAVGLAVCYLFGTAWYAIIFTGNAEKAGFAYALSVCVLPFIPFDLAKLALAFAVCARTSRFFKVK